MDLKTQIFQNMKAAMKDKNTSRVAALRLIRDAFHKAESADGRELDDRRALQVPGKQLKPRQESIESRPKGGRADLFALRALQGKYGDRAPGKQASEELKRRLSGI